MVEAAKQELRAAEVANGKREWMALCAVAGLRQRLARR
jgi:hypothetical protein